MLALIRVHLDPGKIILFYIIYRNISFTKNIFNILIFKDDGHQKRNFICTICVMLDAFQPKTITINK